MVIVYVIIDRVKRRDLIRKGYFAGVALTGVIAVRVNCHISLLFIHKAYHQRGIARSLCESMVDDCRRANEANRKAFTSSPLP